ALHDALPLLTRRQRDPSDQFTLIRLPSLNDRSVFSPRKDKFAFVQSEFAFDFIGTVAPVTTVSKNSPDSGEKMEHILFRNVFGRPVVHGQIKIEICLYLFARLQGQDFGQIVTSMGQGCPKMTGQDKRYGGQEERRPIAYQPVFVGFEVSGSGHPQTKYAQDCCSYPQFLM